MKLLMNKSSIMKTAWRIFRKFNLSFSEALKKAWAAAKCMVIDFEFPNLEGSEKQIKWAQSLRKDFAEELKKEMPTFRRELRDNGFSRTTESIILAALALKKFLKETVKSSDFINTKEYGKGYWIVVLFKNFKDNFWAK